MSMFIINVDQQYYKDNYDDGMDENTLNVIEYDSFKVDGALDEAVKTAIDRARNYNLACANGECTLDADTNEIFIPCDYAIDVDDRFIKADEKKIERWKAGKIDLWNVEYIIRIQEVVIPDIASMLSDDLKEELRICG